MLPGDTELHIKGWQGIDAAFLQEQKVPEVRWNWTVKETELYTSPLPIPNPEAVIYQ